MMKRKLMIIMLGAAMCFTLAACGANNSETDAPQQTQETDEAQVTEPETESEPSDDVQEEPEVETETAETTDAGETGTYPDGTSPVYSGEKCILTIDGEEVVIDLYDNTAVDAFLERLPLENLNFSDLSGIEKPIDRPDEPFSLGEEEPGYDPVTGEMVIYRPWGNFTIFYGDFRHSDELVPLGKVESGLDILAGKTEDFTGTIELMEE